MDQEPNPHPLIATPLHGVKYIAKRTHRFTLYLLHALESVYLEALPHLLWLGRPLLHLWQHDSPVRKHGHSIDIWQNHWHDIEAGPMV